MRRAGRIALLFVALAASGCPSGSEGDDDGGTGVDAATGPRGVTIHFETAPPLPAQLGDVRVDEVQLRLRDVRLIGDAAAGDPRVSRSELQLDFKDGDAPDPLRFADAPPGIYSRVQARLDGGGDHAYSFRGVVNVGGSEEPFEIEDDAAMAITIELSPPIEVRSGHEVVVRVAVAVSAPSLVSWADVLLEEGRRKLEDDNPQIATVRTAVHDAFAVRAIE